MKISHAIDLHKALTAPLVFALMMVHNNYTAGAWSYLALHGSYGWMWCIKSQTFPDLAFEGKISVFGLIGTFLLLMLYWVAPMLLISGGKEAPGWIICLAVTFCMFGCFLMFGSDLQKFTQLRIRKGLITNGFFTRTRNPNYLGEVLIYLGFATLTMHWIPFVINSCFLAFVFMPRMQKKDKSMSRYPEWSDYVARTGLFLPNLRDSTDVCRS